MDKMEVARNKSLRGDIIKALYNFYGEDIRISHMKSVLRYSGYNDQEIKKSLFYLGGTKKEYVHIVLDTENYMDSLIWLTPTGVNLAEGDILDVGVEF